MKIDVEEKTIAFCVDDGCEEFVGKDGPGYWLEKLELSDVKTTVPRGNTEHWYVVSFDINKYDCGGSLPPCTRYVTEDFTSAYNMFKERAENSLWSKVFLCGNFESDYGWLYDDGTPYCPSSTAGDYSPSAPWNAPGMSVHDFI